MATAKTRSSPTIEREWGRLWRGQLMRLLNASHTPGPSPLSLELLRAVVDAGEVRASDLASQLYVTKTSIGRNVKEMLDEKLLLARRDPSDGRATLLSASSAGKRALQEREARRSAGLRELFDGWSDADVATFTALLQRFNDRYQERLRDRQRA